MSEKSFFGTINVPTVLVLSSLNIQLLLLAHSWQMQQCMSEKCENKEVDVRSLMSGYDFIVLHSHCRWQAHHCTRLLHNCATGFHLAVYRECNDFLSPCDTIGNT